MESLASVLTPSVAVSGSNYGFGRQRLSLFVTSFVDFGRLVLSPVAAVGQKRRSDVVAFAENGNNLAQRAGMYMVGDFMTRKEELHVVKTCIRVVDNNRNQ